MYIGGYDILHPSSLPIVDEMSNRFTLSHLVVALPLILMYTMEPFE